MAVITHHRKLSQHYNNVGIDLLDDDDELVDDYDVDTSSPNNGIVPVVKSAAETAAQAAVANAKFARDMSAKQGPEKAYLAHMWNIENMPRLFSPAHLEKTTSEYLFIQTQILWY